MMTPEALEAMLRATGRGEFVVVSEWLGYLPYGRYAWFEDLEGDTTQVEILVARGVLVEVSVVEDGDTKRTTYKLAP